MVTVATAVTMVTAVTEVTVVTVATLAPVTKVITGQHRRSGNSAVTAVPRLGRPTVVTGGEAEQKEDGTQY